MELSPVSMHLYLHLGIVWHLPWRVFSVCVNSYHIFICYSCSHIIAGSVFPGHFWWTACTQISRSITTTPNMGGGKQILSLYISAFVFDLALTKEPYGLYPSEEQLVVLWGLLYPLLVSRSKRLRENSYCRTGVLEHFNGFISTLHGWQLIALTD